MEESEITLLVISIIWFTAYIGYFFVQIFAVLYGKIRLHRNPGSADPEKSPGITVLKPLVGDDLNLVTNLESFFNLKYPQFELLFCIPEKGDASEKVVRELISKYPAVDAQVLVGAQEVGINPKINNMNQGYKIAKYDLLMISDSNLKTDENSLTDMVSYMKDEKVGLVHQMPFVADRPGFAAKVEKIFFGTSHAKAYLMTAMLGIPAINGMSCLYRKKVIDDAGGLKAFSGYLAEDFFIAQQFVKNGWKHRLASIVAYQNSGSPSLSAFQARFVRWAKLRYSMLPWLLIFEPLSECMVLGTLTALMSALILSYWSPLVIFLSHVLFWFLLDFTLLRICNNGALPFSKFDFLIGWLFRECTTLFLLIKAWSNPYISWRGRRFRIRWGGCVEEVPEKTRITTTLPPSATQQKLIVHLPIPRSSHHKRQPSMLLPV